MAKVNKSSGGPAPVEPGPGTQPARSKGEVARSDPKPSKAASEYRGYIPEGTSLAEHPVELQTHHSSALEQQLHSKLAKDEPPGKKTETEPRGKKKAAEPKEEKPKTKTEVKLGYDPKTKTVSGSVKHGNIGVGGSFKDKNNYSAQGSYGPVSLGGSVRGGRNDHETKDDKGRNVQHQERNVGGTLNAAVEAGPVKVGVEGTEDFNKTRVVTGNKDWGYNPKKLKVGESVIVADTESGTSGQGVSLGGKGVEGTIGQETRGAIGRTRTVTRTGENKVSVQVGNTAETTKANKAGISGPAGLKLEGTFNKSGTGSEEQRKYDFDLSKPEARKAFDDLVKNGKWPQKGADGSLPPGVTEETPKRQLTQEGNWGKERRTQSADTNRREFLNKSNEYTRADNKTGEVMTNVGGKIQRWNAEQQAAVQKKAAAWAAANPGATGPEAAYIRALASARTPEQFAAAIAASADPPGRGFQAPVVSQAWITQV